MNALRPEEPLNSHQPLFLDTLGRTELPFPQELEHLQSDKLHDQLSLLQNQTGVYSIALIRDRLVILGASEKLKRAAISAEIFLNT